MSYAHTGVPDASDTLVSKLKNWRDTGRMWLFGGGDKKDHALATPPHQQQDDKPTADLPIPTAPTSQPSVPEQYRVIPAAFDATRLHPMANVGTGQLEYLDLETNAKKADGLIASRGFSEDLSYGTGAMYLLGLGTGGLVGLVEGLRSTQDVQSARLRLNSILNAVTRRGPFLGNTAGCLTLTYNLAGGLIDYARDGYHDEAGSLAAGAITGALFNASRGGRPMLVSSGLVTVFTAGWLVLKRAVSPPPDA